MKKDIVKTITRNAIVAAIYFLLTLINPFSFGIIQVRISEVLVLLCFFNRDYVFGITLGCLLANTFGIGTLGLPDIIFGTLATFISCVAISFFKHLLISCLCPILINGIVVSLELYFTSQINNSFFIIFLFIVIGETIAILVGYVIFMLLKKSPKFFEIIRANKNTEFKW